MLEHRALVAAWCGLSLITRALSLTTSAHLLRPVAACRARVAACCRLCLIPRSARGLYHTNQPPAHRAQRLLYLELHVRAYSRTYATYLSYIHQPPAHRAQRLLLLQHASASVPPHVGAYLRAHAAPIQGHNTYCIYSTPARPPHVGAALSTHATHALKRQ